MILPAIIRTAKWAAWEVESSILSLGPSQLAGTVGLIVSLSKVIYSQAQVQRCRALQKRLISEGPSDEKSQHKVNKALKKIGVCSEVRTIEKTSVRLQHYKYQRSQLLRASASYALLMLPVLGLTLYKENQQRWKFKTPELISDVVSVSSFAVPFLKKKILFKGSIHKKPEEQSELFIAGGARTLYFNETGDHSKNKKTIILFHGNGGSATSAKTNEFVNFYADKDLHVIAIAMGGYPLSERVPVSEVSIYEDVEGVIAWVKCKYNLKNQDILCHGISLGGSLAVAAGEMYPGLAIIADQTFRDIESVSYHCAANLFPVPFMKAFTGAVAKGLMKYQLQPVYGKSVKYKLDGLNNKSKLEKIAQRDESESSPFLAISATDDYMMNKYSMLPRKKTKNVAEELVKARYGKDVNVDEHHFTFKAGHASPFCKKSKDGCLQEDQKKVAEGVHRFLKQHGFIS